MSLVEAHIFRSQQSIGFGATLPQRRRESETEDEIAETAHDGSPSMKKDRLKGLSTADLVEYGFIPESVLLFVGEESLGLSTRRRFVGRLPILAPLHPLSLSDLVRILVEPKNALVKQYRKLFARYGCELQFTEKALYAVAEEASKRGGSARHLRSTLEELLLDAMYEIPGSVSLPPRCNRSTADHLHKDHPICRRDGGRGEKDDSDTILFSCAEGNFLPSAGSGH
jgi:ATP-dependent Clp protease ATP-binding subunit ClpX